MDTNLLKTKRFLILTCLLFVVFASSYAQVGVSLKWNSNNYSSLGEGLASENDVFGSSYEIGVNYWFRLKNKRIEFLPEIAVAHASKEQVFTSPLESSATELSLRAYFINFHTNIYLLDLANDCDCPTFSKDGNKLSKGFHLIISPGYGITDYSIDPTIDPAGASDLNFLLSTFKLGLGAGFDIGINNLLTLTPHILYNRYFIGGTSFLGIEEGLEYSNSSQLQFGLRLILRPDYVKNFGYR